MVPLWGNQVEQNSVGLVDVIKMRRFFKSLNWELIGKILVADLAFFFSFYYAFLLANEHIFVKLSDSLQGRTMEQVQSLILSSPEQAQQILLSLKSSLVIFIVVNLVLAIAFFMFYSYTRSFIWNNLRNKKFKNNFKWNGLNLALFIPLLGYILVCFFIGLFLKYIYRSFTNDIVFTILNASINLIFIMIFILYLFIVYYVFTDKNKVWNSIGESFNLIKLKWSKLWVMFLYVIAVIVVVNLFLYLVGSKILLGYPTAFSVINSLSLFLIFTWMRIYLVKTIS